MRRLWFLAVGVLFLASFTVSATPIYSSVTYTSILNGDPDTGLLSGTLTVPQFDVPNQWTTLTGVTVTIIWSWSNGTASVTNGGAVATTFYITDTLNGTIKGGPTTAPDFNETLVNQTGPIAALSTVNYPGSGTFNGSVVDTTDVSSPYTGFVGSGNVQYTASAANDFDAGCSGTGSRHCAEDGSVDFSAELEVTYNSEYQTPEPATMAGAGLGLLAFGLLGRRLRRR